MQSFFKSAIPMALCFSMISWSTSFAVSDAEKSEQLTITSVELDFGPTMTAIFIHGDFFENGAVPIVRLGRALVDLTNYSDGLIQATTTSDLVDGQYLLTVSTGDQANQNGSYELIVGAVGLHGEQGPQGEQGPIGLSGPAGPPGNTGPVGPTGQQGPMGPSGPQGAQGPVGATGSQGPEGRRGPEGPIGPAGPALAPVVYRVTSPTFAFDSTLNNQFFLLLKCHPGDIRALGHDLSPDLESETLWLGGAAFFAKDHHSALELGRSATALFTASLWARINCLDFEGTVLSDEELTPDDCHIEDVNTQVCAP